ncbi:hypothetical protein E2C01_051997 [Portunus trituberculatus]|uniref:Uncharacterized protein n=1 Tax=Portunus trituberculatus TaxID=210409 RepID=A0A5B7GKD6_PORTR|nr:hypothetical protein [Portunus trituberculatus]
MQENVTLMTLSAQVTTQLVEGKGGHQGAFVYNHMCGHLTINSVMEMPRLQQQNTDTGTQTKDTTIAICQHLMRDNIYLVQGILLIRPFAVRIIANSNLVK